MCFNVHSAINRRTAEQEDENLVGPRGISGGYFYAQSEPPTKYYAPGSMKFSSKSPKNDTQSSTSREIVQPTGNRDLNVPAFLEPMSSQLI